jgi:hypothetical protein
LVRLRAVTSAGRRIIIFVVEPRIRKLLSEIERRKEAREDPCDSCDATGMDAGFACSHCLGQKVLLTAEEFDAVLTLSGFNREGIEDDYILSEEYFEAK